MALNQENGENILSSNINRGRMQSVCYEALKDKESEEIELGCLSIIKTVRKTKNSNKIPDNLLFSAQEASKEVHFQFECANENKSFILLEPISSKEEGDSEFGCLGSVSRINGSKFTFNTSNEIISSNIDKPEARFLEDDSFFKESLPNICNDFEYKNLKSILKDYLFGKINLSKKFSISDSDLNVLKYLLKKKLFYSHNANFIKKVDSLTLECAPKFLYSHPFRKRLQVFKKMVFSKFLKFMKERRPEVKFPKLSHHPELDYMGEMNKCFGNLANTFYQRCFANKDFRERFIIECEGNEFWNFCEEKSYQNFNKNIDKWLSMIEELLSEPCSKEIQKSVLLKIKFMFIGSDSKRILSIFKLK